MVVPFYEGTAQIVHHFTTSDAQIDVNTDLISLINSEPQATSVTFVLIVGSFLLRTCKSCTSVEPAHSWLEVRKTKKLSFVQYNTVIMSLAVKSVYFW